MRFIVSDADVAEDLAALLKADPRLVPLAAATGPLPLRLRPAGFVGLAEIITSQQISGAAAASIWSRLVKTVDPLTPEEFLSTSEEALRAAGLSRPKIRNLTAAAEACAHSLDLHALHQVPAEEALPALRAVKGIGPWTSEIYLLFCAGHPDIFPAGDLALQTGVQHGLGLPERPSEKALRAMAEAWTPWRGVAARLFWAYYRARPAKGSNANRTRVR